MGMRAVGVVATFLLANPATARVWLVCNSSSYPCPRGAAYKAVSSAIARAGPGDWVLVWPGVYHEKGGNEAGVLITTPGVHLRGMDRNLVVVDGSNGTAATPCPADPALQDLTPRNGVEVFTTSGTSIENSEWDGNKTGIVPNSLNNDDAPPPQSGLCPSGTGSCTLIQRNFVHDNNNPNVPAFGIAGEAPVGAGIEISGGMFDTVVNNRVENQGAWGIVVHDFPDTETPPPISHCEGGIQQGPVCLFNAKGNLVLQNQLANNGFFGNPTNGDLANESTSNPKNCFDGNTDPAGLTSDPPDIQSPSVDGPPCDAPGPGDSGALAAELACAAGLVPCPPGSSYPQPTQVRMLPLARQAPMPDPCQGLPRNPWCPYTGPRS